MRLDLVEIEFYTILCILYMCVCVSMYIRKKIGRPPSKGQCQMLYLKNFDSTLAIAVRVKSFFSLLVVFSTIPYPETN